MKNYKILENRPDLTKDQIMPGMNFSAIEAGMSVPFKFHFPKLVSLKTIIYTGLSGVAIVTGALIYNTYDNSPDQYYYSNKELLTGMDIRTPAGTNKMSRVPKESEMQAPGPSQNNTHNMKQVQTVDTIDQHSKIEAFKKSMEASLTLIESYRQRVINGESMSDLAMKYSEDPGSAPNGGRYDNVGPGTMVPEFEKVAFSLKPGEISEVFKTQYGYHFVQLIDRKGDLIEFRHILVIPK